MVLWHICNFTFTCRTTESQIQPPDSTLFIVVSLTDYVSSYCLPEDFIISNLILSLNIEQPDLVLNFNLKEIMKYIEMFRQIEKNIN